MLRRRTFCDIPARLVGTLSGIVLLCLACFIPSGQASQKAALPVSYHKQIAPILRGQCQACHQAASPGGKLILTSFADFMKGGEKGVTVVAGKPAQSSLLDYLTGVKTLMPKGGPPLSKADIALFRRWIAEGAKDDTPVLRDPINPSQPPVYARPAVITALAYSPDSTTLAVSGYRETLLHKSDGSQLLSRFVGASQKINSILFFSDGKTLAVAGGSPGRFGELQIWNIEKKQSQRVIKSGYDTLFGASISPDDKFLAVGGVDNTLRVYKVEDGSEVMRLDNHSDWVLATAFTIEPTSKNLHVLSSGRDRAIKLTLVNGGSFIDDINTHTSPVRAMAKHPTSEQVLMAGDDGIPRLYNVFRTRARTMNQEDHNLLRMFEKQPGTISAVAFNPNGSLVAIATEKGTLKIFQTTDGKLVASPTGFTGAIFALAFRPDGKNLAVGGFDGNVYLFDTQSWTLAKRFVPVPIKTTPVASR